jgi:hypothetical protein
MTIKLEESVHGMKLEVGTLIKVDILDNPKDECFGYFKQINDDGIIFCPSRNAALSSNSEFNILVPMNQIGQVYWISKIGIYELQVRKYADTSQISK